MQRAEFVRKTKHVKAGHEDVGYSYVVIRRGQRPQRPDGEVGRLGSVGLRGQQKQAQIEAPMAELSVQDDAVRPELVAHVSPKEPALHSIELAAEVQPSEEVKSALRSEAYYWPRLVFPPLKRSGHIILDACTSEGILIHIFLDSSKSKVTPR
jgi:hypothetical protein